MTFFEEIFIHTAEDLCNCNKANVRIVNFSSDYTGLLDNDYILSALSCFQNLESVSFFFVVPGELIAALNRFELKSLTFWVSPAESPRQLSFETLECLRIFAYGAHEKSHTLRYDFSGMPHLKKLGLYGWESLDYTALSSLKDLKDLIISDKTQLDLSWLTSGYSLDSLSFYGNLESVLGIEIQDNLKYVSLAHNHIQDVCPLFSLKKLSFVDLYKNPVDDPKSIYAAIPFAFITEGDWDKQEEPTLAQYMAMDINALCEKRQGILDSVHDYIYANLYNYAAQKESEYIKRLKLGRHIRLISKAIESKEGCAS